MTRVRLVPLQLLALAPLLATPLLAIDQSVEVRIDVPPLGQERANGLYEFKFAIIETSSGRTLWSNDSSSVNGEEPRGSIPHYVDNGIVTVTLGEPPQASLPPLPGEILNRDDVVLRVWVGNSAARFRPIADRRLRGKGFAFRAETARDAEHLEGRRAADFEAAGAVRGHEERYLHAEPGRVPGGRMYHSSLDLSAGKELKLHFEVPDVDARIVLTLWGGPLAGPPPLSELQMDSRRIDNLAPGAALDVVDVKGSGWLAGIRESWDFCLNCFKRKLTPETEVVIDGTPWEAWKAARLEPPPGREVGRLDNLLPLGLVRFDRSLKVTTRHRGADEASGSTYVWWYQSGSAAGQAPGAVQVLIDGGDVTSALAGLPEARGGARAVPGKMIATRYDGLVLTADALDSSALLTRPASATWVTSGASLAARVAGGGSVALAVAELRLEPGDRRFAIEGRAPAALDLQVDGQWRRAVGLVAPGQADAALSIPAAGWYPARLVSSAPRGELAASFTIDGAVPQLRTSPLMGGDGSAAWSVGPLDLAAAGLVLTDGPHVLTLRERGGRSGHLEYELIVE